MRTSEFPVRLQVYLARCGIASRRKCEQHISDGYVAVNGTTITTQGSSVQQGDRVTFKGRPMELESQSIYVAINKPRGLICTNSDPQQRPLVADLFRTRYSQRLFSVGRLDVNSTGLLFYTNDGNFARSVSHPSNQVEKQYLVETAEPVEPQVYQEFCGGALIDSDTYKILRYKLLNPKRVLLTLIEGKNREIRKLFRFKNIPLRRIHRIRIGIVRLGDLKPGEFRDLKQSEISWFTRRTEAHDRSTGRPRRGR